MQPIHWVIIGVVVIVYIGIRHWLYSDARVSELETWIQLNNYTFQKENDPTIGNRYAVLKRLTRYQNCKATNVIRGSLRDNKFCAFDFVDLDRPQHNRSRYYRGHGPSATMFAAVVVETNQAFPAIIIERETISNKIARTFGIEDVQVESEEFNCKFMARSSDKDKVKKLLTMRHSNF